MGLLEAVEHFYSLFFRLLLTAELLLLLLLLLSGRGWSASCLCLVAVAAGLGLAPSRDRSQSQGGDRVDRSGKWGFRPGWRSLTDKCPGQVSHHTWARGLSGVFLVWVGGGDGLGYRPGVGRVDFFQALYDMDMVYIYDI